MKIAITGRIGSGKSEVLAELRRLGAFVLSCDEINRNLLESKEYLDLLRASFPEAFENRSFDKQRFKDIVFSDDEKRAKLNSIAHPEILKRIIKECEGRKEAFVEVPLLTKEWAERFDEVWQVECDREIRLNRVMRRDARERREIEAIFRAQSELDQIIYPNLVTIENIGDVEDLREKVRTLYKKVK